MLATELRTELMQRHALSQGLTDHLMEGLGKAGLEGLAGPHTANERTDG